MSDRTRNPRSGLALSFLRLALAGTIGIFAATLASPSSALPRYTARYEQKCALCHVNPSGGGLRSSYASRQLVPEEIAWWLTTLKKAAPSLSDSEIATVKTHFEALKKGGG